jgi:hypothetical protein
MLSPRGNVIRLLRHAVRVRYGSNASLEQSWHVGYTSDSGRIDARQRTDASGQSRHFAPLENSEPFVRRTTAELVADLPIGA